jgi:protein-L-isoaspartate O-methyltransferase
MVIYGQIQCGVVLFPRKVLALLVDGGKMIETVTDHNRKQLKASERKRDAQADMSKAERLRQQQQQQQQQQQ